MDIVILVRFWSRDQKVNKDEVPPFLNLFAPQKCKPYLVHMYLCTRTVNKNYCRFHHNHHMRSVHNRHLGTPNDGRHHHKDQRLEASRRLHEGKVDKDVEG